MMNPEVFPSEEIKTLYKELEEINTSDAKKFAALDAFSLVTTFSLNGKLNYIHPNAKWRTYSFRIPMGEPSRADDRSQRTQFMAFRDIVLKWIFGVSTITDKDEKMLDKVRNWFARHMTCFATISIPEFFAAEFESDFNRTKSTIHNITPDIDRIQCGQCLSFFIFESEEQTIECPCCGWTSIR